MKTAEYTWYLEPLDAATNEALSREITAEDAYREVDTLSGRKNLWQCPNFDIVKKFWRSKASAGYRFNVYNQYGNGRISNKTLVVRAMLRRNPRNPRKKTRKGTKPASS